MLGKQLDLFGGAPMPPKIIRVEEETPEASEVVPESLPDAEIPEIKVEAEPESSVPAVSEIFVQMPGVADDSLPITTREEEFPDWVEDENEPDSPEMSSSELVAEEILDSSEETIDEPQSELPPTASNDEGDYPHEMEAEPEIVAEPALEDIHEETGKSEEPDEKDESSLPSESPEKGLNIPADNALYSRQYYTMRETAAMFNVNQSLLRFWENEFDILKPKKNRKGDRYFRPEDIRNLELIYHLLRVRKFTIEGAKEYLKSKAKSMQTFEMVQRLEKLKLFLQDLKTTL